MNRIQCAALFGLVLGTAACAVQKLDDAAFYAANGVWKYEVSRDKCFTATEGALKSIGFTIEKSDSGAGSILTDRRVWRTDRWDSGNPTMADYNMGARRVVTTTNFAVEEQVVVTGDSSRCTVALTRIRMFVERISPYKPSSEVNGDSPEVVRGFATDLKKALDVSIKESAS
jgi:hypothetical protein